MYTSLIKKNKKTNGVINIRTSLRHQGLTLVGICSSNAPMSTTTQQCKTSVEEHIESRKTKTNVHHYFEVKRHSVSMLRSQSNWTLNH